MAASVPLRLPHMAALGLGEAAKSACGQRPKGLGSPGLKGRWGYAVERSHGKDTPSGHWEIAGVPVLFDWGYFPKTQPCFPPQLVARLVEEAGIPGILGNCHASETDII